MSECERRKPLNSKAQTLNRPDCVEPCLLRASVSVEPVPKPSRHFARLEEMMAAGQREHRAAAVSDLRHLPSKKGYLILGS